MKTPIRYAGGKSKAYKLITPEIPPMVDSIVSPFMGGGSMECKWSSELNINVKGYDIFEPLVNFWKVLLDNPQGLADELKTLTPDKETYKDVKEELLCWEKTQDMFEGYKTDYYVRTPTQMESVKAAAYYFFNHNLSYGPMYLGWMSKIYADQKKFDNMIRFIKSFIVRRLSVEFGSFEDVIPSHPNDFLYLDPPYYLEKDKDNKMFKGIYPNANFDLHHTGFDHEKLRDLLHSHKGKFILSYNNCETIRDYYSDFTLKYPSWSYSYSSGETRIGKNKKDNAPKKSHEILIIKE